MNAAVTAMWFTGQLLWPSFGETTVRVYVDNSSEPLAFALDEGLGVGAGLGGVPWGVDTIGKLAIDGGVYTTLRIPFARALRVTAEMAASESSAMTLYFMLRGLDNYQVVLPGSGLELPTAARLRVAAVHNVTLQPLQWQSLVNVSGSGGMLVLMTQTLRSQNAHCLEGIHYLWTRSGREQQVSSGFEDAYLSGQYFDAGPFRTPLAGMTGEDHWIEPNKLSAYRLFHYDPIIFQVHLGQGKGEGGRRGGAGGGKPSGVFPHTLSYHYHITPRPSMRRSRMGWHGAMGCTTAETSRRVSQK